MVLLGPTPPYNNPPIQPQNFQPRRFFIENVTLGLTTTVTATEDMDYVVGQLVRLLIPKGFGCVQLNYVKGYVLSLPSSTEVEININSSLGVNQFTADPTAQTQPQIVPVGDINTGDINSMGRINNATTIPGAFQNISPQ